MVTADGRCRELICHEEVPLGLIEFELQVGHDYLTPGELLALYSDGQSPQWMCSVTCTAIPRGGRFWAKVSR